MKKTFIILFCIISSIAFAQEVKEVTLTEIGQGKTKEAAKYNALRNALEKAFGTFISSNTTIFKDELVKDEIVSISSGNIQKFEILSETQMPDGSFSSVVKATVSIGKLTSFCESKGITVEFKGGLFAANIKLQELNKKNEEAVMTNLYKILNKLVSNGFDYKIDVSEPKKDKDNYDKWIVNFSITATANRNLESIFEITINTISNICLTKDEISSYSNQNLDKYVIIINGRKYYFRSSFSTIYLKTIFEKRIGFSSLNFSVTDGITSSDGISMVEKDLVSFSTWNFIFGRPYDPNKVYTEGGFKGLSKSQIIEKSKSFSEYNSNKGDPTFELYQLNSKDPFKPKEQFSYRYNFQFRYEMEQLSKITQFKVQPITK